MIVGLGSDLTPTARWVHLLERFGPEKCANKILHADEAAYLLAGHRDRLAERLAGRWALREAFGKALGTGLDGWSWKALRYVNGRARAEGSLAELLAARGVARIHATVAHDHGIAFATVILEGP